VGADLYGGVCVNVLRHPAWGRAQETYGEDPFHVGELGAALTRGVQRHAMACVKHFACNSMENARFSVDVTVDDEALHEVFLPHFRRIVGEGVASVMSAYNSVNGEWCGQSSALLTEVLRDEWGFDGFVISDWIFGLRDAGPSVTAGLDVEMPYRMIRATGLDAAVKSGEVTEDDISRCVAHTVATLLRFSERLSAPAPGPDVLACAEHRALAREAATKAIVLLRNEPVDGAPLLPLDPGPLQRVAVVGRLAAVRNLGDHGSSDVWAPEVVTPLEGLRAALPGAVVEHHETADDVAGADAALVVVGYTADDEGEYIGQSGTSHLSSLFPGPDDPELAQRFTEAAATDPWPDPPAGVGRQGGGVGFAAGGDRASLRLHEEDEALIRAVAAANPRTVVAVVAGSAVMVGPWIDAVPAVVQAWYGGMEGGAALADVLLGTAAPGGRLPFSVPVDEEHLPPFERDATATTYDAWHGWWRLERDGHQPAFPFGFGLTYTDFALGPWSLRRDDEDVVLAGSVRNTGRRDGSDVVQVYGGRHGQRRRLLGFARVEVVAGGESEIELRLPLDRFEVRDVRAQAWTVVPGRYELRVARHATDGGTGPLTVDLP
jgi:beta-glucosidase